MTSESVSFQDLHDCLPKICPCYFQKSFLPRKDYPLGETFSRNVNDLMTDSKCALKFVVDSKSREKTFFMNWNHRLNNQMESFPYVTFHQWALSVAEMVNIPAFVRVSFLSS